MKSFASFFYEKLVIGLEEPVEIAGIGELSAKVDSGNGAYNVIHGTNVKTKGNKVQFDSEGGKVVTTNIVDTISINVGAGHTEDRPVIHLDMKIGGKVFKDVPFSISDRSDNIHKVLLGKTFIGKDLDALIDVGKKDIYGEVEIDY